MTLSGAGLRQRGVAVVTALLLTTLAVTIVASLFWQQQVQVRSIENQRLQLQKQWVLRGALDWAGLILREDAKFSTVDHLGEPWAVTLAETRLGEYIDSGGDGRGDGEAGEAALSGSIVDAQSRFNLSNLCVAGAIDRGELAMFQRLLAALRLDRNLAQAVANAKAVAQRPEPEDDTAARGPQPMDIAQVEDLLTVPGFTPEILARLKDRVVVLPRPTPLNLNTASAELLAARIETLSPAEAAALVTSRERAWFRDAGDFAQRMQGRTLPESAGELAFTSSFFFVDGTVHLSRAALGVRALIERDGANTSVRWIREG